MTTRPLRTRVKAAALAVCVIYTGNRAYRARGGLHHLPATATYPLSQFGGA
jgi:hypothetical protein